MIEATIDIDSTYFILDHTLRNAPEIRVRLDPVVLTKETLSSCVSVYEIDPERIEELFEDDESVEEFDRVGVSGDELLFRVRWREDGQLVAFRALREHDLTLIDACGTDARWTLTFQIDGTDALREFSDSCRAHGATFTLQNLQHVTGEESERGLLTNAQREAIELAFTSGYFDIPQRHSLKELAIELGITPQALSDRLRRGERKLVEDAIERQLLGMEAR